MKRVLIACEKSGVVRQAFEAVGCDAWSCDVQPTERPGKHYLGNVFDVLDGSWDLLIAHPPCQYLSYAGNRWTLLPGRKAAAKEAMLFFLRLWYCEIPAVCIENPVGLPGKEFRPPDQIIHPYYFGDSALKRTCLWLRGLPVLDHYKQPGLFCSQTHINKPQPLYRRRRDNKAIHFTEANHGSVVRSKTFRGIANAMALQWADLI